MLARLQQLTTGGLIVLIAAWTYFFADRGQPFWAAAGLGLAVGGYAGVLALEFFLLWRSYRGATDRPGWRELLRAWAGEVACAPRVFLWRQPFRSRSIADVVDGAFPGHRGVVLVHGFVCNRGLWNPWMRQLRDARVPHVAVDLEPVFGSIDDYVPTIDAAVARLSRATGVAPVVVAHSMGGLAVRAWLASDAGAADRVEHVVTIGTPHAGTWMARLGRTTNGRQMREQNPWLSTLCASELPGVLERFTCFYSRCDNIVFPTANATLPGANNRALAGTGHVEMTYHPAVIDEVLRWAAAGDATDRARTRTPQPATG